MFAMKKCPLWLTRSVLKMKIFNCGTDDVALRLMSFHGLALKTYSPTLPCFFSGSVRGDGFRDGDGLHADPAPPGGLGAGGRPPRPHPLHLRHKGLPEARLLRRHARSGKSILQLYYPDVLFRFYLHFAPRM